MLLNLTFLLFQVILASCSAYFKKVLREKQNSTKQPDLSIFLKGVKFDDLSNILDFFYNGEVKLPQSQITSFLGLAEDLQIKGLNPQKASKILEATRRKRPALPAANQLKLSPAKKIRPSQPVQTTSADVQADANDQDLNQGDVDDADDGISDAIDNFIVSVNNSDQNTEGQGEQSLDDDGLGFGSKLFNPNEHVKSVEDTGDGIKAVCNMCNLKFRTLNGCKVHVIRIHGPQVLFECKLCSKVINCSYNLRDHLVRRHGVSGKDMIETYAKAVN